MTIDSRIDGGECQGDVGVIAYDDVGDIDESAAACLFVAAFLGWAY